MQEAYTDYPKAASENAKTALRWAEKNGYNEEYGARPIKRFIQRTIETFIAKKVISL